MRILYIGLSVRDTRRSADWYRRLFGLDTVHENLGGSNWRSDWDEILLKHPTSGLLIGLVRHPSNPGEPFSEFRTGLDHLEFEVTSAEELQEWQDRLDALGIAYSRVKDHIITFRDPDNIQLEFFWPGRELRTGSSHSRDHPSDKHLDTAEWCVRNIDRGQSCHIPTSLGLTRLGSTDRRKES